MGLTRPAGALALALLLASCESLGLGRSCPKDLPAIRDELVTPPAIQDEIIGREAMERTLAKPIDEMIARGGGIEPSLESGRRYVEEYRDILAHADQVRAEYRAAGKPDEWIDAYLLTVRDGATINQAFVDAVECRR